MSPAIAESAPNGDGVGSVRQLADRYLVELCSLDPSLATYVGEPGHDDHLPDVSPTGMEARAELARRTLRELAVLDNADDDDRRCRDLMVDRLTLSVDQVDAGEHLRYLRIIGSPVSSIRAVFDQMPTATDDQWATIARRLAAVPEAYAGVRAALEAGRAAGMFAAPRQALACARQLDTWAGADGRVPFFTSFCASAPSALAEELAGAAAAAHDTFAELAGWLREVYVPAAADTPDGVGADRYQLGARQFLGARLDPVEAYSWSWEELHRIETEMEAVCAEILPGASVEETLEHLDRHGDALDNPADLQRYLQDLVDWSIAELDGRHFEIPEPLRTVEVMLAPPGSAAAQYYSQPSADFARPGRTWNPTDGRHHFPTWSEVSTCYHEAVPGHHLQMGQWVYEASRLSRFQSYTYVSGNIEGWALYAERLMDEFGYLRTPAERLGYLVAQQLRTTRVIVDIGMHLSLELPAGQPFHPGARWSAELGRGFMGLHAGRDAAFLDSEWVRYLGWPGQAICYKLGERIWLAARDTAEARAAAVGETFDLKAWHTKALTMGSTTLAALSTEL